MHFYRLLAGALLLGCGLLCASAQPFRPKPPPAAEPPGALNFSGSLSRVFAEQKFFSADLTMQVSKEFGAIMSVPGKMSYSEGNSRFASDLSQAKGLEYSPEMLEQMKASGLAKTIVISRLQEHKNCTVYPELYSYVEKPDAKPFDPSRVLVKVDEIGRETISGHPCVKNTLRIAAPRAEPEEFTVWNATDLKSFPIRVEMIRSRTRVVLLFDHVLFERPDAKLFEPPPDYVGFESVRSMLEKQARKRK
jgi:hypothetical protein